MAYWEVNRDKEKKAFKQWVIGLSTGLVFVIAVVANFSSGWYKRAKMMENAQFNPVVLLVAGLLIIVFIAAFSIRHKWDMKEQFYKELKARQQREEKPTTAEPGE